MARLNIFYQVFLLIAVIASTITGQSPAASDSVSAIVSDSVSAIASDSVSATASDTVSATASDTVADSIMPSTTTATASVSDSATATATLIENTSVTTASDTASSDAANTATTAAANTATATTAILNTASTTASVATTAAATTVAATTAAATTAADNTATSSILNTASTATSASATSTTTSQSTASATTTTLAATPTPQAATPATLTAVISIDSETYSAELANSSSTLYQMTKDFWENKLTEALCNETVDTAAGEVCTITVTVTGFTNGSIVIAYTIVIAGDDAADVSAKVTELQALSDITILDSTGTPYSVTYSSPTLVTEAPATTSDGLMCHTCFTSDLATSCASGGSDTSAFTSLQCDTGEQCATIKLSNSTHAYVSRGCYTTTDCPSSETFECQNAQINGEDVEQCLHCCDTAHCNTVDAGVDGLGPASLIVLLIAAAVATALSSSS